MSGTTHGDMSGTRSVDVSGKGTSSTAQFRASDRWCRKRFSLAVVVLAIGAGVVVAQDTVTTEQQRTDDSTVTSKADTRAGTGGDSIGAQSPSQRTDLQRRRIAYNFTTFAFGPAALAKMGTEKLSYSFLVGRLWEVNPYAAIKAELEVTSDFDKAVLGQVNLGANFYLLNADVAPYLGGDLGFGIGHDGDRTPYGFDLGGAVGVVLFRTSTVQMSIEGKAHVLFDTRNNTFPNVFAVRLGVMF